MAAHFRAYLDRVHICYVDDSGRGRARTVTGLIIPAAKWNDLMHRWLEGRKALSRTWGVREQVELHGNELARGRGAYCVSEEQERIFKNRALRLRAYDRMLTALAGCAALNVTTVCCPTAHMPTAYARFVEHLERWGPR
ncbi:hypothetical protein RB614_34310 [Phytohabitans sp. ZYX-F-186]|uniref:DUF3800 domain-containing protein n=1 Tax=Phytohabitans maris TaxID=3071409 RepID=A0ABU0ZS85_9ACTN|nr:hypothetical protein [Phytohabitans sp. ZYX-F-186]MDQ7909606.1 hypothetical protein [Phytohabitans sp. ZYX-F-186]